VAECARRGLAATSVATPTTSISVRTAYAPALAPVAARWLVEGGLRIPSDLRLDGRVLRLWAQAVGYVGAGGYVLPVRAGSEEEVQAVGAALAALGLGGQLAVSRGSHQCSYRFVGKRRLARLTELIGDPPKHAPALVWPS
jgi:hypothetical protein